MKKILLLIAFCFVNCYLATAQSKYTAAQVRQRISATASSMKSMTCDFDQTKKVKKLKESSLSHGKMYYRSPDYIRMDYTSPFHYSFMLNGNTMSVKTANGESKTSLSNNQVVKEMTRLIMGSIIGRNVNDSRAFKVSLSGKGNNWQAVMTPKQSPVNKLFRSITLGFDMGKSVVTSIKMIEKNGDTTVITLKNVLTK